ncbi:MAG: Hpt domain-containing protein, partial [Pseudomonadota bacterium]
RKFAFKFLHNTQDGLTQIERALARGDLAVAREVGHRLKSPARTVGALGLGDLLLELEQLPADGGQEELLRRARALLAQLWPLLDRITEQIMTNTTFADDN